MHHQVSGLSGADIGTIASAGAAAIAAGASWVSVLQSRKERITARTPLMSIDFVTPLRSDIVRVHITNHGAAARGVEFAVAVDGQMCWSVTDPPTFLPGETRTMLPAINHVSDIDPIGFVSCYDVAGGVLRVWYPTGESQVYRARDRPDERPSRAVLMRVVSPDFDASAMTLVGFRNVD
jgi:hypothetical protein